MEGKFLPRVLLATSRGAGYRRARMETRCEVERHDAELLAPVYV